MNLVERAAIDMTEFLTDISVPDLSLPLVLPDATASHDTKDIFAEDKRKAWDKSVEARCDFARKVRLTRRGDVFFISLWQKSLYGRTLTDIKADDAMVTFFADNISPLIQEILGYDLNAAQWCIVTTPKRRHLVKNFATRISEAIAEKLDIPFYEDVAHCQSKQRIGAVFTPNNIPPEPNCIVFDDFVTTGSTLKAMRNLLTEHHKNCIFFTGINNKL